MALETTLEARSRCKLLENIAATASCLSNWNGMKVQRQNGSGTDLELIKNGKVGGAAAHAKCSKTMLLYAFDSISG